MGSAIAIHGNNFQTEVLDRSHQQLVMVDFYATWCGPCQMLKPILEKLVSEYDVALAKVDIDQNSELADRYQVQGVPDVRFFRDGQEQPGFVGVLGEAEIRGKLQEFGLVSPLELDLEKLKNLIARKQAAAAKELLDQLWANHPEDHRVTLAAAQFLIPLGKYTEAIQLLRTIAPQTGIPYDQAQSLINLLLLQEDIQDLPQTPAAIALTQGLNAAYHQDYETALEQLLTVVSRDRQLGNDAGRRAMVFIFKLLGAPHPLTQQYQKQLVTALY